MGGGYTVPIMFFAVSVHFFLKTPCVGDCVIQQER